MKFMVKKLGITQVFDSNGKSLCATVLQFNDHKIINKRVKEKNAYDALVLATNKVKVKNLSKPFLGQQNIKKDKNSKKTDLGFKNIFEVKTSVENQEIDSILNIDVFDNMNYVDVTGTSKGKGTQGVIKRWGFHGGRATHGSKFHRESGSTGQCARPARTLKGVKMPGKMGNRKITVQNLKIIKIDKENNVVIVHGSTPGNRNDYLLIQNSKKRGI